MTNKPDIEKENHDRSAVLVTFLDPLGKSIEGLKYQIREGSKVISKGVTDAEGNISSFVSSIGAKLTVHVERFASNEMKQVKTLIPWTDDFRVKLLSPKVKEKVPLKSSEGSPGAYKRKTYVVKAGDTLGKIAKRYGTSAEVLAKVNGLKLTDIIHVGKVIKLPVEKTGEPGGGSVPTTPGGAASPTPAPQQPATSRAPQARPITPIVPEKSQDRGENGTPKTTLDLKCDQSECIKIGATGPLVEEINIRLMGFGGSVTTSKALTEFTAQTEAAVKQFQRDYMGVAETGKVCGGVIRAMDEFRAKYPLSLKSLHCPCGKCMGFGKNRDDSSAVKIYDKAGKPKAGVEYPGIHRALLWLFRAALFYVSGKDRDLGYSFLRMSSAYRCWDNNKANGRTSTNHMGNALDLQFQKKSVKVTGAELEALREKVFMKRIGVQMRWKEANRAALEATSDGATSWVHVDVRQYGANFKQDRYYATTQAAIDGDALGEMVKRLGMLKLLNCGGVPAKPIEKPTDRKPIKSLKLSELGLEFIKGWEDFSEKPYDDSEGYCTVGYGRLIGYSKCSVLAAASDPEYLSVKSGVTKQRASELLRADVEEAVAAVEKYVHVPLYQQEFDALVSLAFNTGGFRKFKNLVAKVNTGDYSGCCDEFADITNGGTPGLVKRRKAEMRIFRNNVYDSSH